MQYLIPGAFGMMALLTAGMVVLATKSWLRARADRLAARPPTLEEEDDDLQVANAFMRRIKAWGNTFKPKEEEELSELRTKLARAGLAQQSAVEIYATVQVGSLILAGVLVLPCLLLRDPGLIMLGLAGCVLLGLMLPRFWLNVRTSRRKEAIYTALASTLDLLVTCVEAGLGLEQAVDRVAQELAYSEPQIAEELAITIQEMRAGIPVPRAFRKLAERVDLPEMRMLCGVIIQAIAMGASIGQMLRQYAASQRVQRTLDLEELAGKMTARLTLPLTMCLLPSAILSMLGPAAIVVAGNLG